MRAIFMLILLQALYIACYGVFALWCQCIPAVRQDPLVWIEIVVLTIVALLLGSWDDSK